MKKLTLVFLLAGLIFSDQAFAARVWSSGFELNSLTLGVEINNTIGGSAGNIVTSPVNGGTYAYRNNPSASVMYITHDFDSSSNKTAFMRMYLRIATQPANDTNLIRLSDIGETGDVCYIRFTGSGIKLMNSANAQVGSNIALSTGVWYRIELKVFSHASTGTYDLLVDGASQISVTGQNSGGVDVEEFLIGSGASLTHDYFVDDLAFNDASGSFQTSYPGAGKIIHLHPDSAGDSTQWTPSAGSNWAAVDEIPPNDATDYVEDTTLNNSDMYNCGASGIGSSDTVNVVSVGVRFANDVADAAITFKAQIEKAAAGTISQSSGITPNSTTYKTNATAAPNAYPITLYQDPDAGSWSKTTLDSMQIGVKTTTDGANKIRLSNIWALVDYNSTSNTSAGFHAQ